MVSKVMDKKCACHQRQTKPRIKHNAPPKRKVKYGMCVEVELAGKMWMPYVGSLKESAKECLYFPSSDFIMEYIRTTYGEHLTEDNVFIRGSIEINNIGVSDLRCVYIKENGCYRTIGYTFQKYCPEIFERVRSVANA